MASLEARVVVAAVCGIVCIASLGAIYAGGVSAGVKRDAKRSAPIIADLDGRLSLCQADVDRLTGALEGQNAMVDALKLEGDERTRRANEAIRAAETRARGYQQRIARLEQVKPTGDACMAARSLIVQSLKEDRQ